MQMKLGNVLVLFLITFLTVNWILHRNARAVLVPFCEARTELDWDYCAREGFAYFEQFYQPTSWVDMWLGREPARAMRKALQQSVWLRQKDGDTPEKMLTRCADYVRNGGQELDDKSYNPCMTILVYLMRP